MSRTGFIHVKRGALAKNLISVKQRGDIIILEAVEARAVASELVRLADQIDAEHQEDGK